MNLNLFKNPKWAFMLIIGGLLVVFAKILRPVLASMIEKISSRSAFDFVLDALPVIKDNWIIYIYLIAATSMFFIITKFYYETIDIPYAAFVFAFCMLLTNIMFTVTVLGPPHDFVNSWLAWDFNKDLLPSLHVGAPFLAFLLSEKRWVKAIFLSIMLVMIAVVLLMHTHYTIDVLAAIFIFYGVYCLCEKYLKHMLRRFYVNR